jgi:hypothetical protein
MRRMGGSVRLKRPMRPLGGSVRLKRPMRRMGGSVRLKRLMRHKGRFRGVGAGFRPFCFGPETCGPSSAGGGSPVGPQWPGGSAGRHESTGRRHARRSAAAESWPVSRPSRWMTDVNCSESRKRRRSVTGCRSRSASRMVLGVGRAVVTQREDQSGSASAKRLEIWRQLVPLRALLDSPTRLPKAARNWRRTAAGSASVCGASVRTRRPAISWKAAPASAGGGGADCRVGSSLGVASACAASWRAW